MPQADVVIVLVVGLSTVIGLMRGLGREVMSVIVWLTAFFASLALATPVANLFDLGESVGTAVGFAIVFVVVLVAGTLVQRVLGKLIRSTGIGGTDRLLGALFGALRGILVTIVALIAMRPFVETSDWWLASGLVPELLSFERDVLDLMQLAAQKIAQLRG